MPKFYAVQRGRNPGIYSTWSECQKQVTGFSGAVFKSFLSLEEAKHFMTLGQGNKASASTCENSQASHAPQAQNAQTPWLNAILRGEFEPQSVPKNTLVAFVDGSFNATRKRYSFGAVLLSREGKAVQKGAFSNTEHVHARNVAGEIEGVKAAINHALALRKQELFVFYDYEGIEKWALGLWQAKQPLTQGYKAFFKEKTQELTVHFVHVFAHTGVAFNELADTLAKQALMDS